MSAAGVAPSSAPESRSLRLPLPGFLLPWDQLALSAVTVGSEVRGYRVLFEPTVRFVILGGVEISPGTIIRWFLIHVLVLGPALVGLVALGWRRHRAEIAAAKP